VRAGTSLAPNQTGTATTTISYCYDPDNRMLAKGYSTSPNPPQQCSSTPPYLPGAPGFKTPFSVPQNNVENRGTDGTFSDNFVSPWLA